MSTEKILEIQNLEHVLESTSRKSTKLMLRLY